MDDTTILRRITELVDEEHQLRGRVQAQPDATDAERDRLRELEACLDQCWDQLRRRRAARQAGGDPESVGGRNLTEIEKYLQ